MRPTRLHCTHTHHVKINEYEVGPVSSVIKDACRRRPSVSEAEPQLHASIFDGVVPLSPRADAGAPVYGTTYEKVVKSQDLDSALWIAV